MYEFMEIFAHQANSNAGKCKWWMYLFVINDVRWTNVCKIMHNLDIYGHAII